MNRLKKLYNLSLRSSLFTNSLWGISANFLQAVFVSLFFVIAARSYHTDVFAHFMIATTIYQLIVAFSSLSLGQWFIREFEIEKDKHQLTSTFLKIQAALGFTFYLLNVILCLLLYPDGNIRLLCLILGTNIIFDNIIYGLKCLNIAEHNQDKTFKILIVDGFLKLLVGCLVLLFPISIMTLSILMVLVRFATLNLLIRMASSGKIKLLHLLWRGKISFYNIKKHVTGNWMFIIIGSVSVIFWRLANIIIAKFLTLADVANYEISYRILSIQMILPIVACATIYTRFIRYYNEGDLEALRRFYNKIFLIYNIYGLLSYAFIISFADDIILIAFGENYSGAILCTKEMFLCSLLISTILLQANLLLAMRLEKFDMWLNIVSVAINVLSCLIGLYFYRSVSTVNYSILLAFLVFHICQDIVLIKKKLSSVKKCLAFYLLIIAFVSIYNYSANNYNKYLTLFLVSALILTAGIVFFVRYEKAKMPAFRIKHLKDLF